MLSRNQNEIDSEKSSPLPTDDALPSQVKESLVVSVPIGKLSDFALKWLPALAGFSVLFGVVGFVVFNYSLNKYTDILIYSVVFTHYLSAGLSFGFLSIVLFSSATLVALAAKGFKELVISSLSLSCLLIAGGMFFQSLTVVEIVLAFAVLSFAVIVFAYHFRRFLVDAKIADVLILILLYVTTFAIFGLNYSSIPRAFGGGQPASVYLVLRETENIQFLDLQLQNGKETDLVCLLAETNDSYLIFDPRSKQTVVIKYDDIVYIRDTGEYINCSRPDRHNSTPIPMASPTPNATPTQP